MLAWYSPTLVVTRLGVIPKKEQCAIHELGRLLYSPSAENDIL